MSINNNQYIKPSISVMTKYNRICKEANKISEYYNILALFFTWILLAGFIIFPGTFTKFRNNVSSTIETGTVGQIAQTVVQNILLIYITVSCCLLGASGICWL
jgi:hypothetical protein